MNRTSMSGASLEKALQDGTLAQPPALLMGVVKPSAKSGYVGFSQSGCDGWVDLPTEMIEHAEHISQQVCGDHSHVVVRIVLKRSKNPEVQILLALLAQMASNRPATASVGNTSHALPLAGDVPSSDAVVPEMMMMSTAPTFGGFGAFGRFGRFGDTLPTCRYERRRVACGSALPGYPVPMCDVWVYCCTWPNGTTGCM